MTKHAQQSSGDPSFEGGSDTRLSVIVPAHNEENYIARCLQSLTEQSISVGRVEVVVAANACTDSTVEIANTFRPAFETKGWKLHVLEISDAGKLNAFNQADQVIVGRLRLYLDADIFCGPGLLEQICAALCVDEPRYATGTLQVMRARSWVTRRYANFWKQLPFVQGGAVGAGCFAVNAAGRARWNTFPDIISDDTFVRLSFAPDERVEVPAAYQWPMVEGFQNLVRVRRRQDAGVAQVARLYPELVQNEKKSKLSKWDLAVLFFTAPIGFAIYLFVHIAVRLKPGGSEWTRGR